MSAKEQQKSQLKELINRGKEQGFLTYAEVNDHLPADITDPDQIEDIIGMINDMGIPVHEQAPDADDLLLSDSASGDTDEDAEALIAWTEGLDVHLNLIPFNPADDAPLQGTPRDRCLAFGDQLKAAGRKTTLRHSLGRDIEAACGQLVKRENLARARTTKR